MSDFDAKQMRAFVASKKKKDKDGSTSNVFAATPPPKPIKEIMKRKEVATD